MTQTTRPTASRRSRTERALSGVEGLDAILDGGLPANHLYLIDGEPGTGKTTLALQFLLEGAKRGERGLYVTLSESSLELHEVAESHGWDLDAIEVFELAASGSPSEEYTIFHPAEVELRETVGEVLTAVERANPVAETVEVSYLADTVVLLRYFEFQGEVRGAISVVKKRSGPHEHTIRECRVARGGLQVGAPLTDFHGVLTGVPEYTGEGEPLMHWGETPAR